MNRNQYALFSCNKALVKWNEFITGALADAISAEFGLKIAADNLKGSGEIGTLVTQIVLNALEIHYAKQGQSFAAEDVPDDRLETCRRRYETTVNSVLTRSSFPKAYLCEGSIDFLRALKKHGVMIGVYSTGKEDIVGQIIEKSNLKTLVDAWRTDRSSYDGIAGVVSDLTSGANEIDKGRIVIFSEAEGDISAGKLYGARSVGISTNTQRDVLYAAGAQYVYPDFTKRDQIIREVFGSGSTRLTRA